ncbi:MAG: his [Bacteroidetes bacterium]|jgi:signal transduction histidine kinase|nr:his [Bacteroidota bacterium]
MIFFRRLPLSQKILLGLVPFFLLFIAVSVLLQNHFQENEMLEEAQVSALTYADIVKESLVSMMVNNLQVDGSFLDRVNKLQPVDTLRIFINDLRLRDELLTDRRVERLEGKYATLRAVDDMDREALRTGEPQFTRAGDIFRGVIPFNATPVCQKCHEVPVGYTLGATDIRISFAHVSHAADGNWKRSAVIFFIFAGLMLGVATLMFRRLVSRPVYRLVQATREISRGNLHYRVPDVPQGPEALVPRDELAVLAARFDEMRKSLSEKIDQLDLANRTLSRQNLEMEETLRQLRQAQEDLVRSERLAVTGRLMAQLSHEVNNPIHNIQSLLQSSVRRLEGNDKAQELITVALEEVVRLAKLTRQMLDSTRGSVHEVEKDIVNVRDLLAEVTKAYGDSLRESKIIILHEAPEDLPPVRGSHDKLKQVLINMVINARDSILAKDRSSPPGPGGGRITLKASAVDGSVRIDITDSGVGIPADRMNRIFDAFFTTKQEVSGVGLGLSVSYGIIQQHQGSITVASKEGEGTVFTITLPAVNDEHD